MILNSRRNVDLEKNPSPRWDLNPRPSSLVSYNIQIRNHLE